MVSYFARHQGDNLSGTDPPSAGYIAWLLWGGDAGRDWAERKAKQIDEQQENSTMNNSTTSIKKLPDYKGLECELKTTVFEKQPLNDPRRYSHVAMCDELGIRSRGYPDAASAVAELKKLVDASMKDRDNSLTQKKLAIIKSNAAPEVKLKALEKLNSPKQNAPSLNELRKLAQGMLSSIQSDVNMLQQGIDQMLQMTKKTQDAVELQSIIDDCKDIKNALGRVI